MLPVGTRIGYLKVVEQNLDRCIFLAPKIYIVLKGSVISLKFRGIRVDELELLSQIYAQSLNSVMVFKNADFSFYKIDHLFPIIRNLRALEIYSKFQNYFTFIKAGTKRRYWLGEDDSYITYPYVVGKNNNMYFWYFKLIFFFLCLLFLWFF